MFRDGSEQAYSVAVGTSSTNFPVLDSRDPTPDDIYYPIGKFWINRKDIRLWYLNTQSNITGYLQSTWELISVSTVLASISDTANLPVFPSSNSATPPDNIQLVGGTGITVVSSPGSNLLTITNTGTASTETLTGDDGMPVSPLAGTIRTLGMVVANATFAKALFTNNPGTNEERFNIQLSAAIPSTNIANVGLSAFSDSQFAVDPSGFVTLIGGSTAPLLGLVPDAHTPPGTATVVPDGSGNITLRKGAIFATGTQADPIRTNSIAANTIDFQIQWAGGNAAVSTPNNFGVSQFDTNSFGVTSGFVTLKNGGTTGAVTNVLGDDGGINTVVPNGSGTITWNGITIANATYAKPVFFRKNSANTEELNVQLTTTSTNGAKNINKSGLAHFDSASFTVDAATGFVSLTAGGTDIQTLTGNSGGAISPTSGNINTLGTGSITIIGSGSTLTTQLTGLTIYNVLIGAGTATINNVPPSATSGIPFISQGAASYPTFGTAVVAGGGTGNTTFTAYSVITAGTTATGPFQNVSGVGTSGQVLTSNGAAQLPTWQSVGINSLVITLDAAATSISPSAGTLIFTGGQVATGVVGTNVIRTRGNAANSATFEIQRTTVSAVSDVTLNGVCHFSSTQFNVNASGFVTFIGSTSNIPWTDEGGNFVAGPNQGYFCTAALTGTLPPTPAQGDVVRIVVDTTSTVVIAANASQKIRIANLITSLAGNASSTKQGDSLDLVYRASSATWYEVGGQAGTWVMA